jgi:hypothetical protein
MGDSSISSIRYKDISDDKLDIAVTRLRCPVAVIRNRPARGQQLTSSSRNNVSFFVGTDNETLSVAIRVRNEDSSPRAIDQQGRLLEKAKQFEHDDDNDNYSDYVEDASVHVVD